MWIFWQSSGSVDGSQMEVWVKVNSDGDMYKIEEE